MNNEINLFKILQGATLIPFYGIKQNKSSQSHKFIIKSNKVGVFTLIMLLMKNVNNQKHIQLSRGLNKRFYCKKLKDMNYNLIDKDCPILIFIWLSSIWLY